MKKTALILLLLWPLSSLASMETIIKTYEFKKSIEDPLPDLLGNPRLAYFPSICPLQGDDVYITSGFGPRSAPCRYASTNHKGIDVSCKHKRNRHVVAPGAGEVVFEGWKQGYGNTIVIRHWGDDDGGLYTQYGHLKEIFVKVGDKVWRWDKIGIMGSTGISTAPHLDYKIMVHENGRWRNENPLDWMREEVPFKHEIKI